MMEKIKKTKSMIAIYYFLEAQYLKDNEHWYSTREVARAVNLSIDRTRKYLSALVLGNVIATKIDKWHNTYKFKGEKKK